MNQTKQVRVLSKSLRDRSLKVINEYDDGHKHVDIHLPELQMNIEVDGDNHYTDPEQILADISRDNYSEANGIHTLRIPNEAIDHHLEAITNAISAIASRKRTLDDLS